MRPIFSVFDQKRYFLFEPIMKFGKITKMPKFGVSAETAFLPCFG